MATERLQVILQMAAGQYKREAREAATATGTISHQAKGATTATGGLQNKMVGFGSVMRGALVLGGVAALGRGIGDAIGRAEEMNSAYAITEQVISQTGGAANLTAEEIKNLSKEQSLLTGVDKALVTEGNNVLLTFKNIKDEVGDGNDVFKRTSDLMLDVATVMNSDAKGAAIQLGKALNDPIANMGALSRSGLTFNQQQKDQIKTLAESGQLLEAQKIILAELETQLGGTAAASADATDKIANQMKELQEGFGTFLLPLIEQVNVELTKLGGDELGALAQQTGLARDSGALLAGALNRVSAELEQIERRSGRRGGIEDFRREAEELIDTAGVADDELRKLRDGLPFLVENFELTAEQAALLESIIAEELAPSSADMAEHAADLEGELNILHGTTKEYGGAVAEVVPTQDALAFEMERAAAAAKAQREEQVKVRDGLREIHNPVFRLISLNEDLEAAEKKVNEAATDEEFEDAIFARAEVIADLEAAFNDLQSQGIDPAGAAARLMFEGLGFPPGLIDDMITDVEFIQAYLEANPFRFGITVPKIGFSDSGAAFLRGRDTYRHAGGPGEAGRPYVIRPDEEIFVPSGNGQFLLNSEVLSAIKGLAGSLGGGSREVNYNIPITSSGNQNADAQLVGAVASVLRRMETL